MSEEDQKTQSPQDSIEKAATSQDQNAAINKSASQLNQESQKKVSKLLSMVFSPPSTQSNQQATTSQLINALRQEKLQLLQQMQTLVGLSSHSTSQSKTQATTNQPQPQQASSASLINGTSTFPVAWISIPAVHLSSAAYMMADFEPLDYNEKIANFDEESKQPAGQDQDSFNGVEVSLNNENEKDDCPICLGPFKESGPIKATGACDHVFHAQCLEDSLKQDFKCPVCRAVIKKKLGPCPNGHMYITGYKNMHCAGYENCGTIVINYELKGGVQGPQHPNPGVRYCADGRQAYLPDNEAGKEVLKLLKKAWEMKLTFRVGTSLSTGAANVITWNDIHHKTRRVGGSANYGYPDETYLERVTADMHALGVRLDE